MELKTRQVWTSWRDEQFARAAAERREKREVRAQQLRKTRGRPTKTTSTGITTQLSTPISPTAKSLMTPHTPKLQRDRTCTEPRYELGELTDPQSTGM